MNIAPQNQRVVDIRSLPEPPDIWPDPDGFSAFAEWLRALTSKKYKITQRVVAEVTGATPQAVTKWLNGGMIEAERLARLAEWSGFSYQSLRRLLDEPKIGIMKSGIAEPGAPYFHSGAAAKGADELLDAFSKLSNDNRQQLLGMAKLLLSKQRKGK